MTSLISLGTLMSLTLTSHAEPPRGTPWPFDGYAKQNGGNTYNCATHNELGGSQWDRYALDFKIEETGENSGDKIAAMADGRVVQRTTESTGGAWGNMLTIDHGYFLSRYAHLRDPALPEVGDRVRAGQTIGYEGRTGVTDVHLHFQWGKGTYSSGTAVLPEPITGRVGTTYSAYKSFDTDYATYTSSCPGIIDSTFYGARPLTDVFLYSSATGAAQTRLAVGNGTFSGPTLATWSTGWRITAGHFNSDERVDLFLWNDSTGAYRFMRANASPLAGQQDFQTLSSGTTSWLVDATVYPMDLDLDGFTDLLVHRDNGDFRSWLTDGAGGWTIGQTGSFSPAGWPAVVGQFTNDMRTDLLRFDPSGTGWQTWHGTSTGITSAYSGTFGSAGWLNILGKFNDSGNQDIYRYDPNGNGWAIRTGGSGNWTNQLGSGSWSVSGWSHHPGYFNNGETTDIIQYTQSTGAWKVQRSDGTGGWVTTSGTFDNGRQIRVGFYDGDTWGDLLLYDPASGQGSLRLATGPGTFSSTLYNQVWQPSSATYREYFNNV